MNADADPRLKAVSRFRVCESRTRILVEITAHATDHPMFLSTSCTPLLHPEFVTRSSLLRKCIPNSCGDQGMPAMGSEGLSPDWISALDALRSGQCVAILDGEDREGETDLFFPASTLSPSSLRFLRTQAGGELYISVGHEVASAFGFPFIGSVLSLPSVTSAFPVLNHMCKAREEMCQGNCSVGLSLDHRQTKTGAPDVERSFTCRRLAELYQEVVASTAATETAHEASSQQQDAAKRLGDEFHTPGHIFLCVENSQGLRTREGHTELSIAVAKAAQVTPVMVGCVMLSNEGDEFGALSPQAARTWAASHGVPFLTGTAIAKSVNLHRLVAHEMCS